MSPVRHAIFCTSLSASSRRGRRLSSDKSSAHAGTPARTRSASTQLPMQPPAPVTTTGPGKLARSIEKRSFMRSEEHTSELQSPCNLVCRLLLEKKKKKKTYIGVSLQIYTLGMHHYHIRR